MRSLFYFEHDNHCFCSVVQFIDAVWLLIKIEQTMIDPCFETLLKNTLNHYKQITLRNMTF